MSAPTITALLLRADSPPRLGRFYRQLLGVDLVEDDDGTISGLIGELTLAIVPRRNARSGWALGPVALTWRVDDIDASLARARQVTPDLDVGLREDRQSELGRHVTLFDPEGNEIGLFEPHSNQAPPPD